MDHGLVDGVGGLVGEDARREARHQLLHLVDAAALHHIVVDEDVLAEKFHLVLEVAEQPAYLQAYSNKQVASGQAATGRQAAASRRQRARSAKQAAASRRQADAAKRKHQFSAKFKFHYFSFRTSHICPRNRQREVARVKRQTRDSRALNTNT